MKGLFLKNLLDKKTEEEKNFLLFNKDYLKKSMAGWHYNFL